MTKKITTVLVLLFNILTIHSQEVKYSEITKEQKGYRNSYLASDGAIYKIGDKIKIGLPSSNCNSTFTFIKLSNNNVMTSDYSGQEVKISNILVFGDDKTGYSVFVYTKGYVGEYEIQFESALKTKEVISLGKTSDEALQELKKEKEKLDLQIITQEDYDRKKLELMKYIK